MTPVEVRSQLVDALRLDLVGPDIIRSLGMPDEVLPQPPSRWYLTGFLVPLEGDESQRSDETSTEELDGAGDAKGADDAVPPEPTAARRAFFPSSMGVSILAPPVRKFAITVRWGDYEPVARGASPAAGAAEPRTGDQTKDGPPARTDWRRTQREERVPIAMPDSIPATGEVDVPDSRGLRVAWAVRGVPEEAVGVGLPPDTRCVSLFLVNRRKTEPDEIRDAAFAFQAQLEIHSERPLVPRPNLRSLDSIEWEERVADLQYRNAFEFAVGHSVATEAVLEDGTCRLVRTCWIPQAEVERVAPTPISGVELGMDELGLLADGSEAQAKLSTFVSQYRDWIAEQRRKAPTEPAGRAEIAAMLLQRAEAAAARIERGIRLLNDPTCLEAFRIANRVMAAQAKRRLGRLLKQPPETIKPTWRPFQLAFVLMNLPGIADPNNDDREVVDLLFFPTGGGKTEAYLGLAAFTLVLRRLRNPGLGSAGLSVLMRYTLRLLTLDQLGRAAALMCALELERQQDVEKLGQWPFEIGLWVGKAATPNRMGCKGDPDRETARAKTIALKNDNSKPSPIPLEECPWCGTKFKANSFQLVPNPDFPLDLRVMCVNRHCEFSRGQNLPILAVDEPIYRRLPCFLIATVDKFAALPWVGEVGAFFGRVSRYDKDGFYGPCQPTKGNPLPEGRLPPPDLVIQDELHLISGPLGTMMGLYESALDELCRYQREDHSIRPKIIASTATVRRAESQIRALFNRQTVDIFPPPGPDRRDSFFALVHTTDQSNARLYAGVAAQGRSLKVVMLRVYLALLAAAQRAYDAHPQKNDPNNPADPYMTLLGYFNSLRELGGARRLIEDEISSSLVGYRDRKRVGEGQGLFANRTIAYEVVELTSREPTNRVSEAKQRLENAFCDERHVDVAIATNMISVGLDITRLGLMVVYSQPKTSSEYIQATSRVGRDHQRPGLVVTLLNINRPRDRSHYERFTAFHESFYRSVEATSVTPFSPRALDRGLAGTLVGLARQVHSPMTAARGAGEILNERARLDFVAEVLANRAQAHRRDMSPEEAARERERVRLKAQDILEEWSRIAMEYAQQGVTLQYQTETGGAQRLLYDFLDPQLKLLPARHWKFRANRSLRDVEPSVNLWLKTLDGIDVEEDEL